ncbi:myb-like protein A [Drosophila teissieri]|uniref:myb-like protein A n=1 Tax=Drosophila teissieri TaxID=7243 RepID=UPI001CBA4830|nr:myb-like protein A [Drosophila teissieri]
MAAQCRRYRNRRPKCTKTMSLATLILGLSLAVATLAAGNDAISAPKAGKDLQQQQQPSEIGIDGGERPNKDFDFAAYVNDFNLQEEASIPEDIFDQHDGDIGDEDVEEETAHIQYAPSAALAPSAASAAAEENEHEDDDDDDVALLEEEQEQEDDASEAADIILESQRPTTRNFSVYLDAKIPKYQNNNSKQRSKEQRKKSNISHHSSYKLKNNKANNHQRLAKEAVAGKSEMETLLGGATKFTSGDEPQPQQEDQEERVEQEDDANFGRQSLAKSSQRDKKRGDDGDEVDLLEGAYPPSQLFDAIEILNERKFNKPSGQSTTYNGRFQLQKKEQEHQKSKQVDEAIGDIEDNLDNDEILPTGNAEDEDDGDVDDDEDIRSAINNDELAKKYPVPSSTTTTKVPTTSATSKTTSSSTTTTATFTSTTATTPSTTTTPRAAAPTIGRKLKRNFFGQAQPESMYYGSYDIGRIRAQTQEKDTTEEEKDEDVGELHYYDTSSSSSSSGGNSRKLVSFEPEKSEENYLSSYYTGKSNATEKKLQQQQQQQHVVARNMQHATRYVDDDYAEQQPPAEKSRMANPWEKADEKPADAQQLEDGKLESDLESALQRYHEATTATPTVSAAPSSAFERFKALRRSRQRTGHKSHKKRYKDYLKRQQTKVEATPPPPEPAPVATISARHLQKLQKERERSTHSAPIFALGLRPQRTLVATGKPFYEGQVNYYDNQQQDADVDLKHHTEMERLIAHDNGNWYRRISPLLRNGVKSDPPVKEHHHQHHHHHSGQHLGNHHHHSHHHSYNHNAPHSHHHHSHSHSQQKLSHLKSRPRNPYQRKVPMGVGAPSPAPPPTPPLPPPKPQLGHQITELEHLERYYAKWPHLARVQFQVYDEHYRETHPELYSDYEDDYESAAELEEAQQERGEEANLPPYIKKYNRRNKQLLNLLEGTLPTPTLSPGNPLGSTETVRLDDEYLKEKRRRYHQHQRFEDLFAQQKSRYSTTQSTPKDDEVTALAKEEQPPAKDNAVTSATTAPNNNQLPEEDALVVSGEETEPAPETLDFWQREVASKAAGSAATTTPKPALFKLPSYPAIAGSFLGTPRSRSRSAQFVANVAGRGQSSWPRLETGNSTEKPAGGTTEGGGAATATGRGAGGGGGGGGGAGAGRGDPSPLNSFVYHRVVDGIGAGGASGAAISGFVGSSRGKQSRLPFVAITDRRLEKSLAERHKDFEQNHFPMP